MHALLVAAGMLLCMRHKNLKFLLKFRLIVCYVQLYVLNTGEIYVNVYPKIPLRLG